MIPKIIHYCWISGEDNMPDDIKKCIASWKEHLTDYEFINWNDSNFDWNVCEFTRYNREHNNYAFCADYVRFWALYNYGGIYLDSDVMVYKSFDDLLSLDRIITREVTFTKANFLEAAIIGCNKGDEAFKEIINWYDNCEDKWSKFHFVVAPAVMRMVWKNKYKINNINHTDEEIKESGTINVLRVSRFFNSDGGDAYAEHLFKTSWNNCSSKTCLNNNDTKIFLCAHKPFDNYVPKIRNKYIILDVSGTVKDEYHDVIDISKDDFTKNHNICYGEGCALRWLWKHQELLPDYVCFGHYRRMFIDMVGQEKHISKRVDLHNAIIKTPSNLTTEKDDNNIKIANYHHNKEYMDVLISSIKEVAPFLYPAFVEFSNDKNFYACNCFAMKKEDFNDMCEVCFSILDDFDKKLGFKNNTDVFNDLKRLSHRKRLFISVSWQARLQGFLLEYLTDSYFRYKWGADNCFQCNLGVSEPLLEEYEDYIPKYCVCKFTGIHNLFANPSGNFMFNITCKNACSYLKYITLLNNGYDLNGVSDYHYEFINRNLCYHPVDADFNVEPKIGKDGKVFNPDDYKMIYIYRDPFERFVSTYNDKVKNKLWFSYRDSGLHSDTTFKEFLEFAEYNIKNRNGNVEEHIRPQIDYYTTRVDCVVPLEKLQKFIKEHNLSDDFSYINSFPHVLDEYEKYRDRVYKLYENDLKILTIYKDKIYQ